jgi:hypothetical protein
MISRKEEYCQRILKVLIIISPGLEAAFIAKKQAIRQRLDVTDSELKELCNTEEAPDDDEDVDEMEEQGTDTNN